MFTKCRFTGKQIVKPPVKLIGAKTRWRDILYQYFPKHQHYFEPFMGTAGVVIGKEPSRREFIGDLNEYAINFYAQIQEHPEELWEAIQGEIEVINECANPKVIFEGYKYCVTRTDDKILKAICFYLITKLSMNGIWRLNKKGECNSSYCGTVRGRGLLTWKWFELIRERIKNIFFIHTDYNHLLFNAYQDGCLYGNGSTFVFLDPPYHSCKTTYNGISWGDTDYIELENRLPRENEHLYQWLLTINDDPFIRELFKNYYIVEHDVHYSCSQTNSGRGKRPELLIANYDIIKIQSRLLDV